MNKIISILLCLCVFIAPLKAQKVGLVLSGGGAKGITHIGIIRALEENNIPIDYVAGTSMGAIYRRTIHLLFQEESAYS